MQVVDLFSGAGGLVSGAVEAGFEAVASFENWDCALDTLRRNFDHSVINGDLADVEQASRLIDSLAPEVIIGGPPCQDFSRAGQGIEGERAELTTSFAEIVARSTAEIFVMENVPNVRNSLAFRLAQEILIESGFQLAPILVEASLFGVPQSRKRLFLIGARDRSLEGLETMIRSRESIFPMTVRRYWNDVPFDHFYRHPRTYMRRGVFSVDEPSPTIRGMNRPRPANYVPHKSDTSYSNDVRALTTSERAWLQTFSRDFVWQGTGAQVDQMIGNAVPPRLSYEVFSGLRAWLSGEEPRLSFEVWLTVDSKLSRNRTRQLISTLRRLYHNSPAQVQSALAGGAKAQMVASFGDLTLKDLKAIDTYLEFLNR